MMMNKKKLAIAVVVLVAIAFGGWKFYTRPQSKEFSGQLKNVSGDQLTVSGLYVLSGKIDLMAVTPKTVTILVDQNTSFRKTVIQAPTAAQIKQIGKGFDPNNLKREVVNGSLEELKNHLGLNITITADENVWGSEEFRASEINYAINQ